MVSGALETLTAAGAVVAPTGEARDEGVVGAGGGLPSPPADEAHCAVAPRSWRGTQAWIRYGSGQTIPVGFDQLRWEHFTGSVPWRRIRSRHGQAHLPGEYFVTVVACQAIAPDGAEYGCNRDGSEMIRGCGWYLEIAHDGGLITRYCHLLARPQVAVGQRVATGEPLARVGASGNASGPQLHFEVRVNGDPSAAGAIDPVTFSKGRGAPLDG
jgi:hypothetical protein